MIAEPVISRDGSFGIRSLDLHLARFAREAEACGERNLATAPALKQRTAEMEGSYEELVR